MERISYHEADVYVSGQDGYHTYRIPSLLVTKAGTLLAFCEGRKRSAADLGDVDLMVKRSSDNGATWSPQQIVHEEGGDAEITIGNPCPVVDRDTGVIWMPFCRDNKQTFVMSSADDGLTWSTPREVDVDKSWATRGHYATGPGVGIQLAIGPRRGRLLIPCDHRDGADKSHGHAAHILISDDHGETWRRIEVPGPGGNECQAVELEDGSILLNARMQTHYQGRRAVAVSQDGGETWSPLAHDDNLPCPICQASFARHSFARGARSRLLFSNPDSAGNPQATDRRKVKGERVRMTVRLSYDDGKSWPIARLIHSGPSAYSCLAALPNGEVGLLYEKGKDRLYESLSFARFFLKWLTEGADR